VNYYKTKAKNIWKLAQILLDKSSPLWLTNPYPKGSSSPNPPSFGHLLSQGGQKGTQKIEGQIEELMKLP
jgi:endonuclease III